MAAERRDRTGAQTVGPMRAAGVGTLIALLLAPPGLPQAHAAPSGGQIVPGTGAIEITDIGPDVTNIDATDGAVIDWNSFDILRNETVEFFQTKDGVLSPEARVLNRVLGPQTRIDGNLLANGQVYIVNPSGIFFGGNAVVDVGRLVAAAGILNDADFAAAIDNFTDLTGPVENHGTIQADVVHLLGLTVANRGVIVPETAPAGMFAMVAGQNVLLTSMDGHVSVVITGGVDDPGSWGVENTGQLDAGSGEVFLGAGDVYSLAVNHTGITRGNLVRIVGGDEGRVAVAGSIDVSSSDGGGVLDVRGGEVTIDELSIEASEMDTGKIEVRTAVGFSMEENGIFATNGADLLVVAETGIVVASIDTSGGEASDAGAIALTATTGDVDVARDLTARGGDNFEDGAGGAGGDIKVEALAGSVAIDGHIDSSGGSGATGGAAGDITILASLGSLRVGSTFPLSLIDAAGGSGDSAAGSAGSIQFEAHGRDSVPDTNPDDEIDDAIPAVSGDVMLFVANALSGQVKVIADNDVTIRASAMGEDSASRLEVVGAGTENSSLTVVTDGDSFIDVTHATVGIAFEQIDVTQTLASAETDLTLAGAAFLTATGTPGDDSGPAIHTVDVAAGEGAAIAYHLNATTGTARLELGSVKPDGDTELSNRGDILIPVDSINVVSGDARLTLRADSDADGVGAILTPDDGIHIKTLGDLVLESTTLGADGPLRIAGGEAAERYLAVRVSGSVELEIEQPSFSTIAVTQGDASADVHITPTGGPAGGDEIAITGSTSASTLARVVTTGNAVDFVYLLRDPSDPDLVIPTGSVSLGGNAILASSGDVILGSGDPGAVSIETKGGNITLIADFDIDGFGSIRDDGEGDAAIRNTDLDSALALALGAGGDVGSALDPIRTQGVTDVAGASSGGFFVEAKETPLLRIGVVDNPDPTGSFPDEVITGILAGGEVGLTNLTNTGAIAFALATNQTTVTDVTVESGGDQTYQAGEAGEIRIQVDTFLDSGGDVSFTSAISGDVDDASLTVRSAGAQSYGGPIVLSGDVTLEATTLGADTPLRIEGGADSALTLVATGSVDIDLDADGFSSIFLTQRDALGNVSISRDMTPIVEVIGQDTDGDGVPVTSTVTDATNPGGHFSYRLEDAGDTSTSPPDLVLDNVILGLDSDTLFSSIGDIRSGEFKALAWMGGALVLLAGGEVAVRTQDNAGDLAGSSGDGGFSVIHKGRGDFRVAEIPSPDNPDQITRGISANTNLALTNLLITNQNGRIVFADGFESSHVTSGGDQTYVASGVQLGGDTTLNSGGSVSFSSGIDGEASLTVTSIGDQSYGGAIAISGDVNLEGSGLGDVEAPIRIDGGADSALTLIADGSVAIDLDADGFSSISLTQRDAGSNAAISRDGTGSVVSVTGLAGTSSIDVDTTARPISFAYRLEDTAEDDLAADLMIASANLGGDSLFSSAGSILAKDAEVRVLGAGGSLVLRAGRSVGAVDAPIRTRGIADLAGEANGGGFFLTNNGPGDIRVAAISSPDNPDEVTRGIFASADVNLANLDVEGIDIDGSIVFADGFESAHVNSVGSQTYRADIRLQGDTLLSSGGDVRFEESVEAADGHRVSLAVAADGAIDFQQSIGSSLDDLIATSLDDLIVTSGEDQTYAGPVVVNRNTTLTSNSGGIRFASTIDGGAYDLAAFGEIHFDGMIGFLESLATLGPGATVFGTKVDTIRTEGLQFYGNRIELDGIGDKTFRSESESIIFGEALDGPGGAIIESPDAVVFGGDIGTSVELAGLTVHPVDPVDPDQADPADIIFRGASQRVVVGAGGIFLNPGGQTPVPVDPETEVATIYHPDGSVAFVTTGDFTVGKRETISVAGALSIEADGTVTVGDVVAFSLNVTAPEFNVRVPSEDDDAHLIANQMVLATTPNFDGRLLTLATQDGTVRMPGPIPEAFRVRLINDRGRAIEGSDLANPTGGAPLDLLATGPDAVGNPVSAIPQRQAAVSDRLEPGFGGESSEPTASRPGGDEVLAFLRCADLGGGISPGCSEPVALTNAASHPALATPRIEGATRLYRQIAGPGDEAQGGRRAYQNALDAYQKIVGWGFEGAGFYRYLESSPDRASALRAVDRLATLFVELRLLDLEPDELQRLRQRIAQQFLEPTSDAEDRRGVTRLLDTIDAGRIGLPR